MPNDLDRLQKTAPRMLEALQRLTHPASDETDLEYALAVVAYVTGQARRCECASLQPLCELCAGTGYVPLPQC